MAVSEEPKNESILATLHDRVNCRSRENHWRYALEDGCTLNESCQQAFELALFAARSTDRGRQPAPNNLVHPLTKLKLFDLLMNSFLVFRDVDTRLGLEYRRPARRLAVRLSRAVSLEPLNELRAHASERASIDLVLRAAANNG